MPQTIILLNKAATEKKKLSTQIRTKAFVPRYHPNFRVKTRTLYAHGNGVLPDRATQTLKLFTLSAQKRNAFRFRRMHAHSARHTLSDAAVVYNLCRLALSLHF